MSSVESVGLFVVLSFSLTLGPGTFLVNFRVKWLL